jgi:hypothetical protein
MMPLQTTFSPRTRLELRVKGPRGRRRERVHREVRADRLPGLQEREVCAATRAVLQRTEAMAGWEGEAPWRPPAGAAARPPALEGALVP